MGSGQLSMYVCMYNSGVLNISDLRFTVNIKCKDCNAEGQQARNGCVRLLSHFRADLAVGLAYHSSTVKRMPS